MSLVLSPVKEKWATRGGRNTFFQFHKSGEPKNSIHLRHERKSMDIYCLAFITVVMILVHNVFGGLFPRINL
jgi:hypothetical protein